MVTLQIKFNEILKISEEIWRWLEKKKLKSLKEMKKMMSKFWNLWRKIVVNHMSEIYKSFNRIYNIIVLTRKDCMWMYNRGIAYCVQWHTGDVMCYRLHLSEPIFFLVVALIGGQLPVWGWRSQKKLQIAAMMEDQTAGGKKWTIGR